MTICAAALATAAFLAPTRVSASTDIAEVAPLASMAPKAVVLGNLLANPLVPALLVSSMQQSLTTSYGHLRSDKPLFWVFPSAGRQNAESIPVLPCAEGIAQFTLNHPGSTRSSDGSVHLLAAENRPYEMVAVFAPDGYVAFALSVEDAKKALAATDSARRLAATKSGDPLVRLSLGEEAFASAAATAANIGTNRSEVVEHVAGLDASVLIDDSGITINAHILPKPGVTPEKLCEELDKSLGSSLKAFGSAENVRPVCKFTPHAGKVQSLLSLPASEMKKAGKAFNTAIVQAMAPEKPSEKKPRK